LHPSVNHTRLRQATICKDLLDADLIAAIRRLVE
jgi:hypothetical protein